MYKRVCAVVCVFVCVCVCVRAANMCVNWISKFKVHRFVYFQRNTQFECGCNSRNVQINVFSYLQTTKNGSNSENNQIFHFEIGHSISNLIRIVQL